jgi:Holliday junction resolvase RusA-like endonuclease
MEYTIPIKLMPKKRPSSHGRQVFMPREYQQWKQTVRDALAVFAPVPTLTPVNIGVEVRGPSRNRGDVDNLLGGLMDAIQPPSARGDVRAQRVLKQMLTIEERMAMAPGCLIGDDGQVKDILYFRWRKAKEYSVTIRLEESPEAAPKARSSPRRAVAIE